jgi:hypothetical protein
MAMLLQGVYQNKNEITNGLFREAESTAEEILKACGDIGHLSAFNHGVDVSFEEDTGLVTYLSNVGGIKPYIKIVADIDN